MPVPMWDYNKLNFKNILLACDCVLDLIPWDYPIVSEATQHMADRGLQVFPSPVRLTDFDVVLVKDARRFPDGVALQRLQLRLLLRRLQQTVHYPAAHFLLKERWMCARTRAAMGSCHSCCHWNGRLSATCRPRAGSIWLGYFLRCYSNCLIAFPLHLSLSLLVELFYFVSISSDDFETRFSPEMNK